MLCICSDTEAGPPLYPENELGTPLSGPAGGLTGTGQPETAHRAPTGTAQRPVTHLTSQPSVPGRRGCRVDIEVISCFV